MSLSSINPRKSSVTGLGDFVIDYDYKITNYEAALAQLDTYYGYVKRLILRHQSITLGLFPFNSGDDEVADVRTSLYCAIAIWALYQSYRRIDDDKGRSHELSHSAIKCMRGILWCWMRQADRVEQFKQRQFKEFALHVKFHLLTGDVVIPDHKYNHLQLDVVSLYLLTLVQIITSGLQVIYCMDEVKFIQNLVYYVERAYRTPDFGMWERGTKYNNGTPEIHASSIGMAKAALEAINGCNLFGDKGASWSVIYVDIDAHDRNRSIFETLLPRESRSKNADCALLPTLSFPAFGTHDDVIYGTTKEKVIDKLEGEYGFKRFLRDGFGSPLEDPDKMYYDHGETKKFDSVESEWPLFFIYLIIDGMFKADQAQVKKYQLKLRDVILYSINGDPIVPLYYFVEEGYLECERQDPGSQPRTRSRIGTEADMFLWGQSLYIISQLLVDGVLHINELDPIRRYLPSYNRPRNSARYSAFQGTASDLVVQVVLVSESMRLQAMMATYGIQTQTPKEIEPIQICSPGQLVKIYRKLGVNKRLELTGRPARPIGALGTSKIYRILGHTFITYPLIFEVSDFYLSYDMALLIDDIKSELKFVGKFWRLSGRPTVCILIREEHMRDANFKKMLDLLAMLKSGHCDEQKIRLGRLQNFMASSCIEHLDFLDRAQPHLLEIESIKQLTHVSIGYQSLTDIPKAIMYSEPSFSFKEFENKPTYDILEALKSTDTLFAQSGLLGILMQREGENFLADTMSVRSRLMQINKQAGVLRVWKVVRLCSSLLHKLVDSLSPSLSSILVNGKEVTIGIYGKEEVVLDKPMTPAEIRVLLYQVTAGYDPVQAVLQQEILLYAGKLIATNPKLFSGLLKFRIGWVLRAMSLYLKWTAGENMELEACSPSDIRQTLYKVLTYSSEQQTNIKFNHHQKRQLDGCLGRVPKDFFIRVWHILMRTEIGVNIGTSMISRKDMAEMTVTDFDFAITIETMLNRIPYPEYRQLNVELIMVMSTILERNPELHFVDKVKLDDLIGDALVLYLKDNYNDQSNDMESFYAASHGCVTGYLSRAVVNHILKGDLAKMSKDSEFKGCHIS